MSFLLIHLPIIGWVVIASFYLTILWCARKEPAMRPRDPVFLILIGVVEIVAVTDNFLYVLGKRLLLFGACWLHNWTIYSLGFAIVVPALLRTLHYRALTNDNYRKSKFLGFVKSRRVVRRLAFYSFLLFSTVMIANYLWGTPYLPGECFTVQGLFCLTIFQPLLMIFCAHIAHSIPWQYDAFGISRELKVCFIFWFIFHNLALATTLVHYFSGKGGVYRYVPHVIVAVDALLSFLVTVAWPLHTHSPSHMRKRHYRTPKAKIPSLVRYWSFWGLRAVRRRLQQAAPPAAPAPPPSFRAAGLGRGEQQAGADAPGDAAQTVHLGRRRSSQVQATSRVTFDGLPTRKIQVRSKRWHMPSLLTGRMGEDKVACAAAGGNAPRSFADAVRGWGSARGGGGGPGLSARMAAVDEEAEEAPAPFEGGGGGGGDNEDAVFLDPQLRVACAAAAGNAPRSFADAVRGWGSARGGGGGPGLSARMAAVDEEAEEAPAPFEGGGGGGGDNDAVFLDPQFREEMLDFARRHFVSEMALFLVAVHDFSKLCAEHVEDEPTARQCHVEKVFKKYCDILDEFIKQNSNHEINISHKMRARVMRFNGLGKKSFAAAPAFETRTIFKEPFEEVKKLFYTNYIVRFI